MFKICIAGCGDIALKQHGPAIHKYVSETKNTAFAACCDIDPARARAFAERFGIPRFYVNLEKMLDIERPDAVSLCVPVELTADLACRVLSKGFPLITEKPPGINVEENRRMAKAAEQNPSGRIPNFAAFNRRHMPVVQKAMELIEGFGGAGCITDIRYRMLRVNRTDANFATTAIHGIDLVRHIASSPYGELNIAYRAMPQYGAPVTDYHINGTTENGIAVGMDFLPMSGVNTERLEINTTRGLLELRLPIWAGCRDGTGRLTHYENDGEAYVWRGEEGTEDFVAAGFYRENALFFNALRNGEGSGDEILRNGIASGLQAVEIADYLTKRKTTYQR
ncbi:MAG: Gfo/Idh/MocA family oxidoreductase [Defluviitaleaceae bacterium]|nr:Gfo/Idh/MocA family oxidoreductase [Defluviitaleaceae bacterium]